MAEARPLDAAAVTIMDTLAAGGVAPAAAQELGAAVYRALRAAGWTFTAQGVTEEQRMAMRLLGAAVRRLDELGAGDLVVDLAALVEQPAGIVVDLDERAGVMSVAVERPRLRPV